MNKKTVFEYLFLELAKWFLEVKKASWEDFNYLNDFGRKKINLIPFSVCMANGSETRIVLLNVFDKFYSDAKLGIIEEDILSEIEQNNFDHFKFLEDRAYLTCDLEKIERIILQLRNLITQSNPLIIDKIHLSFRVLKSRTENNFPVYTLETLRLDNIQHTAFRKNINETLINTIITGKETKIYLTTPYLIAEKSVYAEKISQRTFA